MELHTQLAVLQQIDRGGMEGTFYKATACPGTVFTVTNELHQFNYDVFKDDILLYGTESIIGGTVEWSLSNNRVLPATVVMTDITGVTTYTQNVDYTVNQYGVITRTPSIPDRSIVRVAYQWNQPCVDLKTGTPNLSCSACSGWGAIYPPTGVLVVGLLHIPRYTDLLLNQGVWRTGDATFTTTSTIDITTRWVGDRFWGKDKIVIPKMTGNIMAPTIRDQEWYVVAPPETISIHNTYLATRLHLRLRNQEGD